MENKLRNKGLTLLELLVAVSIFILVVTMVSGLFAIALKFQRKSLDDQELLAETSYLMEYASRQLRMAKVYDSSNATHTACITPGANANYQLTGGVGVVPPPGIGATAHGIKFINYEEQCIEIYLDDTNRKLMLEKEWPDGAVDSEPLTSENITVEEFEVLLVSEVVGATGFDLQDRVTFVLGVRASSSDPSNVLKVQTTVSQRSLDVN